jgi:hypothetical protein
MTQTPKNPFDREDWFSEVVKSNDSIMNSSKQAFLQFQTKYSPQSMTKFQKVLTFFTTHTITAVLTASICLGGIATFAAQQVAPEQYKPSTVVNNLFKNNKIQQTNPNKPLVSDAQNDVVSYDPCNISIKYPKQIAGEKILAVKPQDYNQPGDKSIPNYYGVTIMSQKSFNYDATSNIQENVGFSCSKEFIPPADNNLNSTMTAQELADLTGWFITGEQKLEEIRTENQATAGPFRTVYFKFKDYYYRIDFTTKKIPTNILNSQPEDIKTFWNNATSKPGIFGDQIQIQFNNVANNVPNVEVLKFDNVPTSGFLFEYDKKLELKNKEKFEFSDPSKNNTLYIIKDKTLQDQITKLNLSNGDSIVFSGQVKNSDSTINITKREEFTITKIDKVEKASIITERSNSTSSSSITQDNIRSIVINSDDNTPIIYKSNIKLKPCDKGGTYKIPKFYMCELDNNLYSFRFPDTFESPSAEKIYIFKGNIRRTMDDVANDYTIVDGTLLEATTQPRTDNINGIIRTDGPNRDEKNGLKIFGDLFVPKSQSVKSTESFDEYSPLDCDIVPIKSYANNSNGMLFVSNANAYLANGIGHDNTTPLRLNQLKEYIKNGKGEVSNPINAFHSGCGGFASQSMKELGYTNKNGRQTRAVLIAAGQEAIADAYVYIFIQQGDKFAMMNTNVYSDIFTSCDNVSPYSEVQSRPVVVKSVLGYTNCMQDLMKNNPEVEKVAKEKMQDLLTTFEID